MLIRVGGASASSTDEKHAFDSAKDLGTAEAWRAFLSSYPSGFYADLARAYLKKLGAGDTGPSERARFPGVTGRNVVSVLHPGGAFVKNGPDTWVEQGSNGSAVFRFKERERTDRDVTLYDASRGVHLSLDVENAVVWYSHAQQPFVRLNDITQATAGSVGPTPPPPRLTAPSPPPRAPAQRVTGCEEGQRLVDGQCIRIRKGEKPGGCPPGMRPVPETDNCVPIKAKRPVRCKRGFVVVDGRCVLRRDASTACGPGYHLSGTRCVQGYRKPPPQKQLPSWQIEAIKKGCKPGQGWNAQEGCHEND
ncbi:MAG: hypothetical protein AB7U49_14995 [Hyphomicrobiaceae bacterium]